MLRRPFLLLLVCLAVVGCATTREVVATKPHSTHGDFVDVQGITTYYERVGDGDPTVVLVHGIGSSTYVWRHNVLLLAEHATVYALDLKGFGASDKPHLGYGLDELRDHLAGFMDAMGIGRAVLVGHSMGGEVVLRLALQQPERVRGLVLIDAAGFHRGGDVFATARRLTSFAFRGRGAFGGGDVGGYGTALRSPGGMNAVIDRIAADDWGSEAYRIEEITAPTLVLWGEDDPVIPVSHAERFRAALPHARVVTYPETGHRPQVDQAEEVNAELTEFLSHL